MNQISKCLFLLLAFMLCIQSLPAQSIIKINQSLALQGKKILLVVAMESEALPIIHLLHLKKSTHSFSNLPMQGYTGKYNNKEILLILNGKDPVYKVQNIGTQAATLTTYLGVNYFHPDLIISIGTAGGIAEQDAKISDIYISKKIYFYDRRIPITGYKEYGRGEYDSAQFDKVTNKINLKPGIVCSGDSFDDNQTDKNIMLKYRCSAIDMEAAGVAWVSMLTHTPMIAIKGIPNMADSKTNHEDFKKNLPVVTQELAKKLKEFLMLI